MAKRNKKTPEQEACETWVQAEMDKIDNPVDLIKFYRSEHKKKRDAMDAALDKLTEILGGNGSSL